MSDAPYNLGNYRYNAHETIDSLEQIGLDGSTFHVGQQTARERLNYDQAKNLFFILDAGYVIAPGTDGLAPCNVSDKLQLCKWPGGKTLFADILLPVLENMVSSHTIDVYLNSIVTSGDVGRSYVAKMVGYDHLPNINALIDTRLSIMKETKTTEEMKSNLKQIYNTNGGIDLLHGWLGRSLTKDQIGNILTSPPETILQAAIRETLEETGYQTDPIHTPIAEVSEYKTLNGTVFVKRGRLFYSDKANFVVKPTLSSSEKEQGLVPALLTVDGFRTKLMNGLEKKFGIQEHNREKTKYKEKKCLVRSEIYSSLRLMM